MISEVKLILHMMKYAVVPSLIKRETSGVLPHPARFARICFIRVRPRIVVCVTRMTMLKVPFRGVDRTRKVRLA
jgi:hypothetical protein